MTKHEAFSVLEPSSNGDSSEILESGRRNGIYVGKVTIFVYVLVTLALAAAVGCIVHFAHPCSSSSAAECDPVPTTAPTPPPTTLHPDLVWQMCVNMSWEINQCKPPFNFAYLTNKVSKKMFVAILETTLTQLK